jgi:CopG-like RHH_1 or ribbon-helix-helix domain, RHH_5
MANEQVSVPLPAELREFVERAAEREDRSIAGQIRHLHRIIE